MLTWLAVQQAGSIAKHTNLMINIAIGTGGKQDIPCELPALCIARSLPHFQNRCLRMRHIHHACEPESTSSPAREVDQVRPIFSHQQVLDYLMRLSDADI
jgi:hypothetical protein